MDLEGEYSRLDHVTNRNNIFFLFSDKIKKWVIFWYTLISIVSGTVPSGDLFTRRQLQKRNMFKGRLLVECFIPFFFKQPMMSLSLTFEFPVKNISPVLRLGSGRDENLIEKPSE